MLAYMSEYPSSQIKLLKHADAPVILIFDFALEKSTNNPKLSRRRALIRGGIAYIFMFLSYYGNTLEVCCFFGKIVQFAVRTA